MKLEGRKFYVTDPNLSEEEKKKYGSIVYSITYQSENNIRVEWVEPYGIVGKCFYENKTAIEFIEKGEWTLIPNSNNVISKLDKLITKKS